MARFEYEGVDASGGSINGSVDALDRRSAVAALTEQGLFATRLEAAQATAGTQTEPGVSRAAGWAAPGWGRGRVSSKDILAMTGQLHTALQAGLPLLNCLEIIAQQQHKAAMQGLLGELAESVSSGESLSDAMAKRPRLFSRLYRAMIRVGETGGILEQTTGQLTHLLNRDEKIKANMTNAAMYPIILLLVGLASVVVIITWILPNIVANIASGEEILPWPTRLLMAVSSFVVGYGWLLVVAVVAGAVAFGRWKRSERGRIVWDSLKLKVPILGTVLRSVAVGRFARTLGALIKGGITILEALGVVRDTLGNELLGRQIDAVAEKVKTGEPVAEPLAASGSFPPLLVQIVSVGEQTGKLDELLLNAADTLDAEADAAVTRFMTILPAVLVLLLAVVIGFIVAATLLPIIAMELGAVGV